MAVKISILRNQKIIGSKLIKYCLEYNKINSMNKTIDWTIGHSLNLSKTKSSHKFSRSQRFETNKSPCFQTFYEKYSPKNVSPQMGKFSKSNRFCETERDLNRKSLSPSPISYSNTSPSSKVNKAPIFGTEKKFFKLSRQVPGPGSYDYRSNPESKPSYSFRMRTQINNNISKNPGPSDYSPNISGLSNIQRSSVKIGNGKRFDSKNNQNPSPSYYNINSKWLQKNHSFAKGSRDRIMKMLTPGPGSYTIFSEFHGENS